MIGALCAKEGAVCETTSFKANCGSIVVELELSVTPASFDVLEAVRSAMDRGEIRLNVKPSSLLYVYWRREPQQPTVRVLAA